MICSTSRQISSVLTTFGLRIPLMLIYCFSMVYVHCCQATLEPFHQCRILKAFRQTEFRPQWQSTILLIGYEVYLFYVSLLYNAFLLNVIYRIPNSGDAANFWLAQLFIS